MKIYWLGEVFRLIYLCNNSFNLRSCIWLVKSNVREREWYAQPQQNVMSHDTMTTYWGQQWFHFLPWPNAKFLLELVPLTLFLPKIYTHIQKVQNEFPNADVWRRLDEDIALVFYDFCACGWQLCVVFMPFDFHGVNLNVTKWFFKVIQLLLMAICLIE